MRLASWNVSARQALVLIMSLAFSLDSAIALEGSWYLGVSAGTLKSHVETDKFSSPSIACDCISTFDDRASSISAFGGYQYNQHVAFEAGFANLPDSYNVRLVSYKDQQPSYSEIEQDSSALFFRSVVSLPIHDLAPTVALLKDVSIAAVFGVSRWRSEATLNVDSTGFQSRVPASFDTLRGSSQQQDSGIGLTFGARISYDINEAIRVGAAWDRYANLGESAAGLQGAAASLSAGGTFRAKPISTVREDVDVFSINLIYRFK
ncbi:MAG: hypothetical protein ACI9DC_005299 [Gammaproteobacteria bacterium]|jgi:hypothetical protein